MKFFIIIVSSVFVAIGSYVTEKLGKNIRVKALVVGAIALIAGLSTVVYERFELSASKPSIEIKLQKGVNSLAIGVLPDDKTGLKAIKLSFHLPVRVKEVNSENRVTEGRAEVVVTGGTELGYLTNRIDIDIYQAHPGRLMNFVVIFNPVTEVSLDYVGKGLYELVYIWSHDSKEFYESEWRRIDTNQRVDMPIAEVGVIRFVGNSEDYGIMSSMKLIGKKDVGNLTIFGVSSVKKGFSYGVKGVDDRVQTPLPMRVFSH